MVGNRMVVGFRFSREIWLGCSMVLCQYYMKEYYSCGRIGDARCMGLLKLGYGSILVPG